MGSAKERLIAAGMQMLLRHGYGNLGIQAVLDETKAPKGSFYHHFRDKEDFALQVIDAYVTGVHATLDQRLADPARPPLERVRAFFDLVRESYRKDGYLGCLMGGLGQELSGVSDAFRQKIEWCFSSIADRIAVCLEQARRDGSIPATTDSRSLASLLVDCWEGAALRSRLRRSPEPLDAMLNFYLAAVRVEDGGIRKVSLSLDRDRA
jgi:TetR/AcrR family transcriptional repressor of nem operon